MRAFRAAKAAAAARSSSDTTTTRNRVQPDEAASRSAIDASELRTSWSDVQLAGSSACSRAAFSHHCTKQHSQSGLTPPFSSKSVAIASRSGAPPALPSRALLLRTRAAETRTVRYSRGDGARRRSARSQRLYQRHCQ